MQYFLYDYTIPYVCYVTGRSGVKQKQGIREMGGRPPWRVLRVYVLVSQDRNTLREG